MKVPLLHGRSRPHFKQASNEGQSSHCQRQQCSNCCCTLASALHLAIFLHPKSPFLIRCNLCIVCACVCVCARTHQTRIDPSDKILLYVDISVIIRFLKVHLVHHWLHPLYPADFFFYAFSLLFEVIRGKSATYKMKRKISRSL